MSSPKETSNLIRSEQLEECQVWTLPDVASDKIVSAGGYTSSSEEEVEVSPVTAEELEKIRKEGFEDGRAEGLQKGEQDGYKKGIQKADAEIQKKVSEVAKLLKDLAKPLVNQENDLEEALTSLVVDVSRAVVRRELNIDSQQVLYAVRTAMQSLPMGCKNMKVFCSPKDKELIQKAAEESGEPWMIFEDENLAPGGVRVETENGIIDYTSELMFQQVISTALERDLSNVDLINHPDDVQPDLFEDETAGKQGAESSKPFPTADDFPDLSLIRRPTQTD